MRLGNLTISGRAVLAPMAGVTDSVFRRLCRRFGAAVVYSEFLSSDGLIHNSHNQFHKLTFSPDEHPVAFQLFGARIENFAPAARRLELLGPDLLDLNFGCPVRKVVAKNGGAAVMKDLDLLGRIVSEVTGAVDVPVTVKMRAGWTAENSVFVDAARIAVDAGAQAVTLHARARNAGYGTPADWSLIRTLRDAIADVPIIGNGDVDSPEAAKAMLDQTGCDAVMVGRAALGRPWIFQQINHFLATGEVADEPPIPERVAIALAHLGAHAARFSTERQGVLSLRRQFAAYIRGWPQAAKLRTKLFQLETVEDVARTLEAYVGRPLPACDLLDGPAALDRLTNEIEQPALTTADANW